MYNPSFKIITILNCNNCDLFITNPNEAIGDCNVCQNCGKRYSETDSKVERVDRVENGKIITVEGNSY